MSSLPLLLLLLLVSSVEQLNAANPRNGPLHFVSEPSSNFISMDGKRVSFRCQASPPGAEVAWLLNGLPLDEKIFAGFTKIGKGRLHIRLPKLAANQTEPDLRVQDALTALRGGAFQCLIKLKGKALISQPAKLLVAGIEPFQPQPDVTVTVTEENIAVIPCSPPQSVPPAVTEFRFNGTLIDRSKGRYYLMPSGDLQIFNVRPSDSGQYRCVSHNPFLREKRNASHVVFLKVRRGGGPSAGHSQHRQSRPHNQLRFVVTPQVTKTPVLGSNVTLECVANGTPPPNVTWSRVDAALPNYRTIPVGGNLVLMAVTQADDGTYVCRAQSRDKSETLSARTVVSVQEPPKLVNTLDDVWVQDGKEFSLSCSAKGTPRPIISWIFNGRLLDDYEKDDLGITVSGTDGGKLTVNAFRKELHEGCFQCFASNELGSTYTFARINRETGHKKNKGGGGHHRGGHKNDNDKLDEPWIDPAPDFYYDSVAEEDDYDFSRKKTVKYPVPTKPEISRLADDSVMVRWTVPSVPRGLPILFFKVQHKDTTTNGKEWQTVGEDIAPHIHSFAVTGLKSETKYRFRVAAVYSDHDNKLSESNLFVLSKTPPGIKPTIGPSIISIEPVSPSAIRLRWHYLEQDQIHITGFFIHFRSASSAGDFSKATSLGANTRSHIISHLLPDTAYEVKMQCFNDVGASEFSPLVSNKTFPSPEHKISTSRPDKDNSITKNIDTVTSNDDKTLYCVLGIAIGALVLVVIVCVVLCVVRHKQSNTQSSNVAKRRNQKPKERHPKANSVHNLNHNLKHDYGNPYGNYSKTNGINGLSNGIGSMKSSISNGFVFKDSTEDKTEIHIRINPLDDNFEGRSRTLSSTTFLGNRSASTRDILRRTASISQHSLHNNHSANNATNNINAVNANNIINNGAANNNIIENGVTHVAMNTIERGRRPRTYAEDVHPNSFTSQVKINHRSSSFTRLNGTLERKRRSRTDLLSAVDNGTLSKGECEPMLTRCNGAANGAATNGHVIMQSSC